MIHSVPRRGPATRCRHLLVAVFLMAILPGPALADRDPEVAIVSPEPGSVVLGVVSVELQVWGDAERVEVLLDGQSLGVLHGPPWRLNVEVGAAAREHVFEAVAHSSDGRRGTARIQTAAFRIDEEVDLQVVELYVTAVQNGQRVADLRREDFTVDDEGVRQEIANFYRGDAPLTAWLLIDTSGSMRGDRLRAAVAGANAFLDGLESQDHARLLLFSDRVQTLSPLTNSIDILRLGLDGVVAQGGTAVTDHLFLALQQLSGQPGRQTVILLSDGIDTVSVLEMSDLLPLARRSGALVYWIRPRERVREILTSRRTAGDFRRQRALLERIVKESGGRIVEVPSLEQSRSGFREILAEIRDQYVLGFYPSTDEDDGRWHRIRVEVLREGVAIRTRSGYLDAKASTTPPRLGTGDLP